MTFYNKYNIFKWKRSLFTTFNPKTTKANLKTTTKISSRPKYPRRKLKASRFWPPEPFKCVRTALNNPQPSHNIISTLLNTCKTSKKISSSTSKICASRNQALMPIRPTGSFSRERLSLMIHAAINTTTRLRNFKNSTKLSRKRRLSTTKLRSCRRKLCSRIRLFWSLRTSMC